MDVNEILAIAYQVIGGLGIFLLGMRYMSDGLQMVAGQSLRRVIHWATSNRIFAVIAGIVVTCLVQSSSVSTVMTVGLVNSGVMTLSQAIGVVMGANIGTTITGWVLVLKIGKYGLPILGVAAFVYLFSKKERIRYVALAILGIGMVFFGLELMKNGFKPIKGIPEFEQWFMAFTAADYWGVLKCALVGCILTVIVQSSSATLGITIGLASTGILQFETAAALVLGENIGTTITAFLASIGSNPAARRSAYFHCVFNLVGVLVITAFFFPYVDFIHWFLGNFSGVENVSAMVLDEKGVETWPYMVTGIALVHTIFNVCNTVFSIPFVGLYAKWLERLVKDSGPADKKLLTHLDIELMDTPFAMVEQSKIEVDQMADHTRQMLADLGNFLNDPVGNASLKEKMFDRETLHDRVQSEITSFLTDVLSTQVGHDLAAEAKQHLLLVDEYESISDYVVQVLKLHLRLTQSDLTLTETQSKDILDLHKAIVNYFNFIVYEKEKSFQERYQIAQSQGDEITDLARKVRSHHWELLQKGKVDPLISTTYSDMIMSYRKLKTLMFHVAETQAGVV